MTVQRFLLAAGLLALVGWGVGLGPVSGAIGILLLVARLASLDEEEAALAAKVGSFAILVVSVWSLVVRGASVLPVAIAGIVASVVGVALAELDRRALARDLLMHDAH